MSTHRPNQSLDLDLINPSDCGSSDCASLLYAPNGMALGSFTYDDFMATVVNVPVTIDALAGADVFKDDAVEVIFLNDPVGGTATIDGGSVVFTPDEGFVGTSTIHYSVEAPDGNSSEATISVEVQTQTAFDSFTSWAAQPDSPEL